VLQAREHALVPYSFGVFASLTFESIKELGNVSKDIFEAFVVGAKFQCLEGASKLVAKLHTHFPFHELHEALGIVYPH
jgi:hypothetical protein